MKLFMHHVLHGYMWTTLHFPFLNSMRFLSVLFSRLVRCLWTAAQLSRVPAIPPIFVTLTKYLRLHYASSLTKMLKLKFFKWSLLTPANLKTQTDKQTDQYNIWNSCICWRYIWLYMLSITALFFHQFFHTTHTIFHFQLRCLLFCLSNLLLIFQ